MKVTLSSVTRYTKDREGNPLISQSGFNKGKPYTRISLKTIQHGERAISGFENPQTKNWQAGDDVEIEVTEKNGYLNFTVPKMVLSGSFTEQDRETLERVLGILVRIDTRIFSKNETVTESYTITNGGATLSKLDMPEYPEQDLDPNNVPF